MRTSDWKCEPMPSAWATGGMIMALTGGLLSFGFGVTGVTRLTETGTLPLEVAVAPIFPEAFCVLVPFRVASNEPASGPEVFMLTLTGTPPEGSGPVAGVTVTNGLSDVTA